MKRSEARQLVNFFEKTFLGEGKHRILSKTIELKQSEAGQNYAKENVSGKESFIIAALK